MKEDIVIVVDKTYILALLTKKDKFHNEACEIRDIIENSKIVIPSTVVLDVMNTITELPKGKKLIKTIYKYFKDNFDVHHREQEIINKSVENIMKPYYKKLSFTDCTVIETMNKNKINYLVSFNSNFDNVENKDGKRIKRIYNGDMLK